LEPMDNVLSITERLENKRRETQIRVYREKATAARRIVQCCSCALRCGMCGQHMEPDEACCNRQKAVQPFHLCETCRADFQDYMDRLDGKGGEDLFWQNEEWMGLWSAWLQFQEALGKFKDSKACRALTGETL
jgi:hypothetical protein